jgi:hypothetical protein
VTTLFTTTQPDGSQSVQAFATAEVALRTMRRAVAMHAMRAIEGGSQVSVDFTREAHAEVCVGAQSLRLKWAYSVHEVGRSAPAQVRMIK